jgi:hypothetical protein
LAVASEALQPVRPTWPDIHQENRFPWFMKVNICWRISLMTGWSGMHSARDLRNQWRARNIAAKWREELWIWHEVPPYKLYQTVIKRLVFTHVGMTIWPVRINSFYR